VVDRRFVTDDHRRLSPPLRDRRVRRKNRTEQKPTPLRLATMSLGERVVRSCCSVRGGGRLRSFVLVGLGSEGLRGAPDIALV